MNSFFITLVEKNQLTRDVYEMIYETERDIIVSPGQFLLCETNPKNSKLRRSYSISDYDGGKIHFIIKELSDGKGGSKAICQQSIGGTMQVWGPMGNFILSSPLNQKINFIGTGTGFAPLYFQAKILLEKNPETSIHFVFGVRTEADLFYQKIFEEWSKKYPHFSYQFCLSQEKQNTHYIGRVTNYIRNTPDITDAHSIYSICGSPAMVREVRDILSSHNIPQEKIFFEQY